MVTDRSSATRFKVEFIGRTKEARLHAGLTQEKIATILRIKQDTYKQYETRSVLPHWHIAAFCAATHITEKWLFTGQARRDAAE